MVTSGLFQIKGNVKIKESLLDTSYLKQTSYWKIVNREGKGYISFGNKYLSYRAYPDDEAIHIPYEDIRKIELEDQIESISDPSFMSKLKSNQRAWAMDSIGIKSILTIKRLRSSQNSIKVEEEKISDVYLKFSYEYLTVIKLNDYSKDNISISKNKFMYSKIRSMEFEDKTLDLNRLEIDKSQIKIKRAQLEKERITKEMEKKYGPRKDNSKSTSWIDMLSKR